MSREQHDRNIEVIKLKQNGLSFSEIGRELNISKQRAHKIYQKSIEKMPLLKD